MEVLEIIHHRINKYHFNDFPLKLLLSLHHFMHLLYDLQFMSKDYIKMSDCGEYQRVSRSDS